MIKAMLKVVWGLIWFTIKATIWIAVALMLIGLVIIFPIFLCAVPAILVVIYDIHNHLL